MSKKKAGKQKVKKPVVRSRAPRRQAEVKAPAPAKVEQTFPCNVLVNKGGDRIAVTVKDAAHQARLVDEFGEASIEVQS